MTAIAGLVYDNTVWIGGDSAAVGGYNLTVRADQKVFQNRDMLFGFTSSFRMGQLLQYDLKIPLQSDADSIEKYLSTTFMCAVRETLKQGGYAKKNSDAEEGGSFLLGYRGRLFIIDTDYQVGEAICNYDSLGCGSDIVKGSLYSTQDIGDPEKRIITALEAA